MKGNRYFLTNAGWHKVIKADIKYIHRCIECHSELQQMTKKHGWKCPKCGHEVTEEKMRRIRGFADIARSVL